MWGLVKSTNLTLYLFLNLWSAVFLFFLNDKYLIEWKQYTIYNNNNQLISYNISTKTQESMTKKLKRENNTSWNYVVIFFKKAWQFRLHDLSLSFFAFLKNVLQISFWEFTEKFLTTYLNMSKWIRIFQKLKEVFR